MYHWSNCGLKERKWTNLGDKEEEMTMRRVQMGLDSQGANLGEIVVVEMGIDSE
jgi:hypothetical protein